jgi:hypothetical protein
MWSRHVVFVVCTDLAWRIVVVMMVVVVVVVDMAVVTAVTLTQVASRTAVVVMVINWRLNDGYYRRWDFFYSWAKMSMK